MVFMEFETKMLSASDDDIKLAGRLLAEGKVVGIPTETVYGLAANALDPAAVSTYSKPRADLRIIRLSYILRSLRTYINM